MTKFVFLNAQDAQIKVTINDAVAGFASDAMTLAKVFKQNDVTVNDDFYNSSDVDFASEEGFATDGCAHELIEEAIQMIA